MSKKKKEKNDNYWKKWRQKNLVVQNNPGSILVWISQHVKFSDVLKKSKKNRKSDPKNNKLKIAKYASNSWGFIPKTFLKFSASADVGFAIYDRYAAEPMGPPPVSYVAHLTGALAGLTIGLLVLKNFEQKLHEQLMWWVALGVYAACTIFAVLFNVFNPGPLPYPWHEAFPGYHHFPGRVPIISQ